MARGQDTAAHPGRQVPRERYLAETLSIPTGATTKVGTETRSISDNERRMINWKLGDWQDAEHNRRRGYGPEGRGER